MRADLPAGRKEQWDRHMSDGALVGGMPGSAQEERAHMRYEGRIPALLVVDGDRWRCWIRDISMGGAGIEPPIPAALGKQVELSSPEFTFEGKLTGRVINLAHRRTCIVFDLDEAARRKLAEFLANQAEAA
jgi:hypothetical protein